MARKVIVQNKEDGEYLKTKLFAISSKIELIPGSGVDIEKFKASKEAKENQLKKKLGIAPDTVVLTFVSRLIRQKGIEELLTAMKELSTSSYSNQVALTVVGDVDTFNPHSVGADIFERNVPNVFFLRERNDIQSILEDSDGFILPTYYREGIPRSILEAMSMSMPIISTNVPGCNAVVKNGVNGYMIEPRDSEKIKEAIIQLLSADRLSMGDESRKIIEENYSVEKINYQYLNLYNSIL